MTNIVVLASHGGSILQSLIDATETGRLHARIALVISNNSRAQALERARSHGIATRHLSSSTHPDAPALDEAMLHALVDAAANWIVLAGYMKKLGAQTLAHFAGRIINTHPALLPKFGGVGMYGRNVHTAVLASGELESGATVHLVQGEYDTGAILSQARVPVYPCDAVTALEERVKVAERELLVTTLADLIAASAPQCIR